MGSARPERFRRWLGITAMALFTLVLTPLTAPAEGNPTADAPAAAGVPAAPQPVHVFNPHSGLCLNTYGASTAPGTPTEIWNCIQIPSEKWEYRADSQTLYNPHSQQCLNLYGSRTEPGTPTEIWACDPVKYPGEVWEWRADGTLYNSFADQCLNVVNGNLTPGTRTEIWPCDTENFPEQKWAPFRPPA